MIAGARHVALAAALAVVQVAGSVGAARGQTSRHGVDSLGVVLLLAGPVSLLLFGRRRPLVPVAVAGAAACLFIGLGYPFGPIFASVAVAFFLAVQAGRRRSVLALGVLAVAGFGLAMTGDDLGGGFEWPHMLLVVGWLTAVLALSEVVRSRREQIAERRRAGAEAQERRLAGERMRLAQELHDVLAHNISLINVQSSVALHLIDEQPERAAEALANVKRASAEALDELRAALDVLRDGESPRTPAPRLAELATLVDGVRAGGLAVTFESSGVPDGLPAAVQLAAYRIVQEALTNVTRHSSAGNVAVRLTGAGSALEVEVLDDGRGATVSGVHSGRGLIGMRERASALGGTLDTGPTATGGFRVAARLPWNTDG